MEISLVEIVRPVGERYWFPFIYEEAGRGFTRNWWYRSPVRPGSRSTFLRASEAGDEVARVRLDDEVGVDHYAGAPRLGSTALGIQFIEVHVDHRLRGIGRAVVNCLHDRYPDRRLVAFSEGADGFWSSLGWDQYVHADPDMAARSRPLYIQPTQ